MTPAVTAGPPSVPPRDTAFGINSHLASRYPNYQTLSQPADVLANTGAGWAREDFQWHRIEPQPGKFDWGFTDRVVELLTARGINIVGVLGAVRRLGYAICGRQGERCLVLSA